jgi:MFS family permease
MPGFFSKDRIVAPPGFNRWAVPPASIGIHLCIGSVYAWSVFNEPLCKVVGVAESAAGDWRLSEVIWIYTVAIVFLGLSAAVAGRWMEQVGPRTVGCVAACCWGSGFLVGALGIALHQLWLVYLGYGVIGGCGLGLGYVSPVSTLIKWFPDRRGMATGMAIMGFGGGAMIGAPLKEWLIHSFYRAPQYLGAESAVPLVLREGVRFADVAGQLREVVVVGVNDVGKMIVRGEPGVYVVGTGSAGIAETFVALGIGYFLVMIVAALSYRLPAPDWKPSGWTPPDEKSAARSMITSHNVRMEQAVRTPQFYLLWIVLCFNVTAGIGILGVAKTMMTDIFSASLPAIVTGAFAATYVQMTSVANMAGRFFWSSVSDVIGRKTLYTLFFLVEPLLYLSIPLAAYQVTATGAKFWLYAFYAATMLIFTMYGGGFATIPAYLADLFGSKYVGGIHGMLLTAWSLAGALGPIAITSLRERETVRAIERLAASVGPDEFAAKFGAPVSDLALLIKNKTVTISKLMEIVPAGTTNPSSTLYNSTMYLMAGLLVAALVANLLVRPVASEHQTE